AGRTGIECFDDWVRELRTSGYLHNHTRMWFASIWIFTLKLPWVLGADFFLRYLIDADPASNTLSWRWVAGIQTRGKTYLARPDNIAKYTQGRYQPTDLATQAPPIRQEAPYPARPIEPLDPIPKRSRVLVLLHGEDLHGFEALPAGLDIVGTAVAAGNNHACRWPFGNKAKVFIHAAVADVTSQMESTLRADVRMIDSLNPHELAEQAQTLDVQCIVTPDAPVGPIDSGLQLLTHALDQHGISLKRFRRAWDHAAWPYAEKGFFPFKKRIPELLQQADLV
ncbi:MAG: FAD-binding domain-containing protein, partial [Pseudomonadota bacterium]